jgi:hypothetical protein
MTAAKPDEDQFSFWSTGVLIGICFRVTPKHEQDNWVVTSRDSRYEQIGQQFVEIYTEDQLRAFAIEQLEDYGITVHDVNEMKS